MLVSDHIVRRLNESAFLPDIISERVRLRKFGDSWKGLCPFHKEKTPSLVVHASYWKCFGCGKGGDAIGFVMKMDGASFHEALKLLSDRTGISLEAKPISRAAMTVARETAEMCQWWWGRWRDRMEEHVALLLEESCLSGNYLALEQYDGWRALYGDMQPYDLLKIFREMVTDDDRREYRAWIAEMGQCRTDLLRALAPQIMREVA